MSGSAAAGARWLQRRVTNFFAKGVIESSNDKAGIQRQDLSLLADEGKDSVERWQNYGFSSHPKRGAEAVTLFFAGGRDHGVIIAVDDRAFRIRGLNEGEVAVYSDEGDTIIFKRGNIVEVTTKTLSVKAATTVTVEAPSVSIIAPGGGEASVTIHGSLSASNSITAPHGHVGP
jgi:phage baseplate assembly protein V